MPNTVSEIVQIEIESRSGARWSERWPKAHLVYLILMSDADALASGRSLERSWVLCGVTRYAWDPGALTREEFERLAAMWPGTKPIPFDAAACDSVQFSYSSPNGRGVGRGFNPQVEPVLFRSLLGNATERIVYESFSYYSGRHVFLLRLDRVLARALLHGGRSANKSLRRTGLLPFLTMEDDRSSRVEVRLTVREGDFEVPISIWMDD